MKNYSIKKYEIHDFQKWNAFVELSINGAFLHNRNFMEYHADRFTDFSLIVLDNEKWIAVLPANIFKNEIYSHQGLTFGSLIYNEKLKLESVISAFQEILKFLSINGFQKLFMKSALKPNFFKKNPADIFFCGARQGHHRCCGRLDRGRLDYPQRVGAGPGPAPGPRVVLRSGGALGSPSRGITSRGGARPPGR